VLHLGLVEYTSKIECALWLAILRPEEVKLKLNCVFFRFARIKICIEFKVCLIVVYDGLLRGHIWLALHELKFGLSSSLLDFLSD